MVVILLTHQHVGVNLPPGLLTRPTQRLQKALPVSVILENLLPAVATRHHLIHRSRLLNAKGTCHCALRLRPQANHRQSKTVIILGLTLLGNYGTFLNLEMCSWPTGTLATMELWATFGIDSSIALSE